MNKYVTGPVQKLGSIFTRSSSNKTPEKVIETIIKHEYEKSEPFSYKLLPKTSKIFLRLSAISGLTAVLLSAYGSHGKTWNAFIFLVKLYCLIFYCLIKVFSKRQDTTKDMRELYLTAQYYHLVHSVAMLSLPIVPRPKIVTFKI